MNKYKDKILSTEHISGLNFGGDMEPLLTPVYMSDVTHKYKTSNINHNVDVFFVDKDVFITYIDYDRTAADKFLAPLLDIERKTTLYKFLESHFTPNGNGVAADKDEVVQQCYVMMVALGSYGEEVGFNIMPSAIVPYVHDYALQVEETLFRTIEEYRKPADEEDRLLGYFVTVSDMAELVETIKSYKKDEQV